MRRRDRCSRGWDRCPCSGGRRRCARRGSGCSCGSRSRRHREARPPCICGRDGHEPPLRICGLRGDGCQSVCGGGGQGLGRYKDGYDLFGECSRRSEVGDCQIHEADRFECNGNVAIQVSHCHRRNTTKQAEPNRTRGKNTQRACIFPYSCSCCSPLQLGRSLHLGQPGGLQMSCLYCSGKGHYLTNWRLKSASWLQNLAPQLPRPRPGSSRFPGQRVWSSSARELTGRLRRLY